MYILMYIFYFLQLREYTKDLRAVINKGGDDAAVAEMLSTQMGEVYRIVSICLGIPPKTFCWEYYDKSKAYHKVGPITPLEFYNEHVKPVYNVEDKVCLGNLLFMFHLCMLLFDYTLCDKNE